RSAKLVDPCLFYNDESKDTVAFEVWYRAIKNKLEVNRDHFHDDHSAAAYITSHVAGNAASQLLPYLCDSHPNQLTTSKDILSHLWSEYYDPNVEKQALLQFNDLDMKPGQDFREFKNTFVRLAGECHRPKSDWKEEFNRRLTPALQTTLLMSYMDPTVDFEKF
ncbi:hypothetical protein QBC38DRAFT_343515, partial [Podospora fimiseda]